MININQLTEFESPVIAGIKRCPKIVPTEKPIVGDKWNDDKWSTSYSAPNGTYLHPNKI